MGEKIFRIDDVDELQMAADPAEMDIQRKTGLRIRQTFRRDEGVGGWRRRQ